MRRVAENLDLDRDLGRDRNRTVGAALRRDNGAVGAKWKEERVQGKEGSIQ